MDVETLVENYPRLFHVAAAGSWPSIAVHGLLPTRELVAGSALTGAEQVAVLTQPRARSVPLEHPPTGA